jgi:hypothetical protein
MPHCPACPAKVPADATQCAECGAPFFTPTFGLLESRLSPEKEAAIRFPPGLPVVLGLFGVGGAAWGLMALTASASQIKGGLLGFVVFGAMAALYAFSGFCGVRTLQRKHGWLRLNQLLWGIQIPVFFSPLVSYSFSSGAFVTAWLQVYPPVRIGWNAWLGSNTTINLFVPGPLTVGVNLLALGICYYLLRAQRSAA